MKTSRFLPVLLLVVSTASGQLLTPADDRLADYLNWFAPLNPSAGLVAPAQPAPGPDQIDSIHRDWSNWVQNAPPTNLPGPITTFIPGLYCEVVFLGQTGDCWGQFGYTNSNTEHLLSLSAADRQFGSYTHPVLTANDPLDFYVERITGDGDTVRYYAFEHGLNSPLALASDGYWGTLAPLSSVRGDVDGYAGDSGIPFAVLTFAPDLSDPGAEPALFVFAVRAGAYWNDGAVPEPSTYGLAAAAALLALVARRRFRSARARAATP